jgi:flagellar biosynthesis/type III secretory pathway M-ring protein FliF/YscJ
MVSIQMKGGAAAGGQLVKAAASMVAGAQSGLSMRNVKVVVNGVAQKVSDGTLEDGTADADSLHTVREKEENYLSKKVSDLLHDIPGVLVSVTVTVNDKATVSDSTKVDQKNSLHLEVYSQSENHEQSNAPPTAADTGVKPNAGLELPAPAAGGAESTSSESKEQTHFQNVPAVMREQTKSGPGGTTPVAASVRIPHSWFVAFAKSELNGKDPDEKAIKQTIEEQRTKTANLVKNTVGLKDLSDVSVEVYADPMPVASTAPPVTAASTMTMAVGGHMKEIVLGGLALLSLFMVSSMVKKAGGGLPAVVAPAAAAQPANRLDTGDTVAGEAGEGGNLLSGVELDEESVRNQQMMDQVSTLVDENPDTATTLVKRWLSQA